MKLYFITGHFCADTRDTVKAVPHTFIAYSDGRKAAARYAQIINAATPAGTVAECIEDRPELAAGFGPQSPIRQHVVNCPDGRPRAVYTMFRETLQREA